MDVASRYKLLEKIGAGSFATVYRAQDQELGREVAVKQIHSQFLAETSQFERYWKEATLLASFQHPNIVTIYDVVRSQGWLVLELMQANIRDRVQGRPMDVKAVQTTLTQGLRALSALHARGLVHGDIKPSNLMIDHRKRVKVGDFGLARRVSHDDGSGIRGTAKYMAPETLSQDFGDVGPQSDLYSLGFTAYELMCGSKFESLFPGLDAFGRDRQAAWMMWHAALDRKLPEPGKALEGVPPALAKVIGKLIEKDPKKRYRTADEALVDLGSPPGEAMTKVSDSEPAKKATGEKSKSRGLVIAVFCASMLLSVGMLFWNPQAPTSTSPTAKLGLGIVRSVDPQANTIEVIDPATGQPEELAVPEKTPIRLRAAGGDELVLLKKLERGDWIQSRMEEGKLKLDVSRPVSDRGKIVAIDPLASKLTVLIEDPRRRERVTLSVPASVVPLVNDEKATLKDLVAGESVSVSHVLDPAGKQGEIASELRVLRMLRTLATVVEFDPASSTLSVTSGSAGGSPLKLRVAPSSHLSFEDGSPATLADLKAGASVDITRHRHITTVVIQRDEPRVQGMLVGVDVPGRTIRVQSSGSEAEIKVAENARIVMNGIQDDLPATLDDLRVNNDQVAVTSPQAKSEATNIRATRLPRYDRAVVAIESSTNQDRSLPVIENGLGGARLLQTTAILRYATPPEWAVILTEPTREEVLASLKQRLEGLRPSSQALVSIAAQAFLIDGVPMLAFADYRPNDAAKTGLPLADLLTLIDSAPPSQKVVMLDVIHPRPGLEGVPASAEALMKGLPRPKSMTVFLGPPDVINNGVDEVKFATLLVQGLSGVADADRDLTITPAEWKEYLTKTGSTGVKVWPE